MNGEIQVTPAAASTAAQVIAAINADAAASALVTASLPAGSTGADAVVAVAKTALAGGVNPPLPLNTPVLLSRAALIASIGDAGSLPAAVNDVSLTAGRGGATVVVVRTADDAAATLAGVRADRTGVYALLDAESETGQRPRLIAAPGAKDAAITTALEAVATPTCGPSGSSPSTGRPRPTPSPPTRTRRTSSPSGPSWSSPTEPPRPGGRPTR